VSSELTAAAYDSVDFESASYTTGGWSAVEVISVVVEAGWSWAGMAVLAGWLATRAEKNRPRMTTGAVAGALVLLATMPPCS
jgi:hypothetical protein